MGILHVVEKSKVPDHQVVNVILLIMKILHISDTHSQHHNLSALPKADVIVHSGDFTCTGSEEEAYDFINWFCDLPYLHKIFISGNHDMCMYGADGIEGLPDNVHYLCNSGVAIEGIKFFGIPMFMEDITDGTLDKMINGIPDDTDILITHQPPFGFGDIYNKEHCGDIILGEKINTMPSLKFHLFGHQHNANSVRKKDTTTFCNAAIMDFKYNIVAQPRLFIIK